MVLSWFVLLGPICVLFTGRWLRTAVAGAWATCLVVVLGIPDGIWGTHLEGFLIGLAAQAPPPRCADPGSLYSEYVTTVYEAGYNARSAQGIGNLLRAAAPLAGLRTIDSQLAVEVNRATAKTT
jgi:hypothetical protein